jgi:hypothetical protein
MMRPRTILTLERSNSARCALVSLTFGVSDALDAGFLFFATCASLSGPFLGPRRSLAGRNCRRVGPDFASWGMTTSNAPFPPTDAHSPNSRTAMHDDKRPEDTGSTISDRETPIRRWEESPVRRRFVAPAEPVRRSTRTQPLERLSRLAPGCSRAH